MIKLRSPQEIELIRVSCCIVAKVLQLLAEAVKVGITTQELDTLAEDAILREKGRPAFKGYMGYPSTLCTSINEQVVHGIPSQRKLEDGDILSVDVGVYAEGYYGDAAVTFPVGDVDPEALKLIRVTKESFYKGLEKARPKNRVSDISHAVETHVKENGFSVVRDFVGHGIGKELHEEPQIPNFGLPGRGEKLKRGMVLAIEPMVNAGSEGIEILEDRWTAVTKDRSLSAHYEHTIVITDSEPDILTECPLPAFM
jgi:methionyl aminopeptidase